MSEEGKAIVKQAVTEEEIATSIAAKATAAQVQKAAAFLKALAHPARLRILCRLSEGPASVGALELYLDLPQAAVSKQLARLRADKLVRGLRDGRSITYELMDETTRQVIQLLCHRF